MRNSYAAKLAEKFSRDIRDGMISEPKFSKVFPKINISKNLSAVDGWALEGHTQPTYFCSGVGGAITGFGCTLGGILDDPIKNIEEALSETVIENVWNWYTSTHLSRFETGCPEIHIATRWSKKDPIGRLTDPDSEFYDPEFITIVIPALDENDKSFCEAIKTTEEYHAQRKVTEQHIWDAEFMQQPIEEKGLLFPITQLKRFKLSDLKGKADAIVSYVDTADKGTDSLCSPVGEKYGDNIYVTDVVFTQDGVEITEPLVAEQCINKSVDICIVESNNGGESFARNVRNIIKGMSTCSVLSEHTSQNKETRILMKSGYIKENFYFRDDYEPGSDYDKYMRALTGYIKLGKNKHDDAPDATTGLAEHIPTMNINRTSGTTRINREKTFDFSQDNDTGGHTTW
jgi:predicted phage terminase large subunit-like protein